MAQQYLRQNLDPYITHTMGTMCADAFTCKIKELLIHQEGNFLNIILEGCYNNSAAAIVKYAETHS